MTTFLDYYKMILDKVSFDPYLFTKEYYKAKQNLQSNEIGDLNTWIRTKGLQRMLADSSRRGNTL